MRAFLSARSQTSRFEVESRMQIRRPDGDNGHRRNGEADKQEGQDAWTGFDGSVGDTAVAIEVHDAVPLSLGKWRER